VVAPRSGGAVDVVRHHETGLHYDPTDQHGLARAVGALVTDRHRGLLGEHARELATRRDWRGAVDELVSRHYERLVAAPVPMTTAG
jgi:phosphatidylinositol alpha 1,6-mannosyltransferase